MRIKYAATLALLFCSVIFSFSQVPNCATTTSPLNGVSAVTTTGAKLTWSAPVGGGTVAGYYLFVGTDAGASNLYNGAKLGNVLTTTLGTLACSQTYNWYVVPFNATGSATGCAISSFSTNLSASSVGTFANYTFSGNANDVSGNSKNGILINSPTSVQDRNGNAGSAYYFNGINQEVQPAYGRVTPPTSFTISLWLNTTATVGGKLLGFGNVSSGLSTQTDRILYTNNAGSLSFGVYNGAYQTISVANVNDGKWHQVVATLGTTSGLSLYLDGNLVSRNAAVTSAYSGYSNGNTGFWRIAYDVLVGTAYASLPTANYFNGSLDDIIIYNRELSYNEAVSSYGAFYNAQGCTGSSLILNASSLVGATYNWSGPNSFTSTLRNPTVAGGVSASSVGLYTLTVNQGSCSYNFNTTVIANPVISNNSISGAQLVCTNGTAPTTLTGTIPSGGDGTLYTYLWQVSTTSSTAGFVPASTLAGSNTLQNYSPPVLAATSWFRRIVYSGGCSDISAPIQVTATALAGNTISANGPISVCGNLTPPTTLTGSSPTGATGIYTYNWFISTTAGASYYQAPGTTSGINYSFNQPVSSTFRVVRVVSSGGCTSTSTSTNFTVNSPITNDYIAASSQSVCTNDVPNQFLGSTPTNGGGGYVYQWQVSSLSSASGFSLISGANASSYTPATSLSGTSWFRRIVTSSGLCVDTSASVQVNVISSIPGDPSQYGNGIWNVYAFNVFNNGLYPNSAASYTTSNGYVGYYTASGYNFNTLSLWGNNASAPLNAAVPMNDVLGYQGCYEPLTNMSFTARGTAIVTTSGIYQINLTNWDDYVTLYVNNILYYKNTSWAGSSPANQVSGLGAYIGPLDPTSLIDLSVNQGSGGVSLAFNITQLTSVPGPLIAGSITGSDQICVGNTPGVFSSVTNPSNGCSTANFVWQISTDSTNWTNLSNSNSASYTPVSSVLQKTWFRRVAYDLCGQSAATLPVVINLSTPPGNQTVYGINMWNAYAFRDNVWGSYYGTWTEPGLSFNTKTTFGNNGYNPPSSGPNYQGCIFNNQNTASICATSNGNSAYYYSDLFERQGFPTGLYTINLTSDDYIDVRVNGNMVYQNKGCLCGTTVAAWTGNLSTNDQIQVYHYNNCGPGYAIVNLIPVTITSSMTGGIIGYDRSVCSGDNPSSIPVPFVNVTSAGNNCYVNPTNGYQWYYSYDNINWNLISNASSASYTPIFAITTTTYFIRTATDICGYTATSNYVTYTVAAPPTPSPTPAVGGTYGYGNGYWNIYAYGAQSGLNYYVNFNAATPLYYPYSGIFPPYAGFYQDSTLNFDTRNVWSPTINGSGSYSGPSNAVAYPSNYNGCLVNSQFWTIWAKRTNLTPGAYAISISNDDFTDLFINNQRVFYAGCCGTNTAVWVGTISGSTLIDVRGSNGNGPGYLAFSLTTVLPALSITGGTIGSNQTICYGSIPSTLTSVTTATSSCYISNQWQNSLDQVNWSNIATGTTTSYVPTLALTTTTYYRLFTSDACGNTSVSNIITVSVQPAISVGIASSNVSLSCSPASVQLQLSSVGGGNGSYAYLWQSSTVSSTTGFNTYTPTGNFGLLWNGGPAITQSTYFRVIVSSSTCSTVASNAFLYTVISAPGVVTQPVSISACVGSNSFLISSITGINVGYVWQSCVAPCASGGYSNLTSNATFSGINAPTLTITGSPSGIGGNVYRVLFTSCGTTLTSSSVNININQPPTINTQPVASTICGSGAVSFSVAASGTALIYQWQSSASSVGGFSNVSNGTPSGVSYSGSTTNSLTVSTTGVVNYFFRALVSSSSCSGISTTSGVALVVNPVIVNNTVTTVSNFVCNNSTTTLLGSVPSGGSGTYTYQWQTAPDSITWTNAVGGTSPTTQNYKPTFNITSSTYFHRVITSGACTSTSTSSLISVNSAPVFTYPIVSTTVYFCAGSTVVFGSNATTPGVVTYQWQYYNGSAWNNLTVSGYYPSVSSPNLTITGFPSSFYGYYYRPVASNGCSPVTYSTYNYRLFPIVDPTFVVQPTGQLTCAPTAFSIPYTVSGTQMTFQWQVNQGSGWNNISNYGTYNYGGTFGSLYNYTNSPQNFVGTPQYALNGAQYQVILTGLCNSATSNTVTLTVQPALANNSISVPQNICFGYPSTTLTGSNVTGGDGVNYTYQWFSSLDNVTFTSIAGANFINYYPGIMTASTYYQRAVNSSNCPTSYSSTPNLLVSVSPATKFVLQPANTYACNGANALFTSSAVGLAVTYKWQYRTSTTSSFIDIPTSPSYPGYVSGFSTNNYNLTYKTPPIIANGYQFRCIAQGNCVPPFDTSNVVTLYINPVPAITTQPQNVTACAASTANFAVIATASGALNYSWLVNPGSGWTAVSTTNPYFNATTSSLGVLASLGLSGNQYEVILTLGNCSVTSSGANLSVNSLVGITSQPITSTVCGGNNTSFSVVATGSGLNYQWITSANGGASWNYLLSVSPYSGANSATLSITSTPSNLNGNLYAVIVSGSCNPAVTSTGVSLAVYSQPVIVSNPVNRFVCSGGNTFFSVSATGLGLSYQWQVSTNSGASWVNLTNGAPYSQVTTNTLSITGVNVSMIGYQYQALVTATCFPTVTSASATLTSAFASTWIGKTNSDWFNANNWCATVPTSTSDVLIQNTAPFMPTITGPGAVCQNISINSGASLTINGSNSLGVYASWTNNGTFNSNNSTAIFQGTASQSISGINSNSFYNLTINNSVGGVILLNAQSVSGSLTLGNGAIFNTNSSAVGNSNGLVLLSTPTGTARITQVPNSATFIGNITMQRYVPAVRTLRFMSSAVNGSTIADWKRTIPITGLNGSANGFDDVAFSGLDLVSVWSYNEAINAPTTYRFVEAPNISMPLNVGSGYKAFIMGDRSTFTFPIAVINSTPSIVSVTNAPNIAGASGITIPVSYHDYGAPFRDGFNFIGNPFPSEIDWNSSSGSWSKTNIDNAIYLFDPELPNGGAYYSYVAGVSSDGRSNGNIIGSSQGFFVKANTTPGMVIYESAKAVIASNTGYFRESSSTINNLLRLKITNGTVSDNAVIRFRDSSTVKFESAFDAYKFVNSNVNISSHPISGLSLSINTLNFDDINSTIPLAVSASTKGAYAIQLTGLESFTDSVQFYLKDNYLNTIQPLNNNSTYSFQITSDTNSAGSGRFSLSYLRTSAVTSLQSASIVSGPKFKAYPNPNNGVALSLDFYNLAAGSYKLKIVDLSGNEVVSNTVIATGIPYFSSSFNEFATLPSGLYVISLVSDKINLFEKVILIK